MQDNKLTAYISKKQNFIVFNLTILDKIILINKITNITIIIK